MPRFRCIECDAVPASGAHCRDDFEALLALEWKVPGGAGQRAHFCAVAAYTLQHPVSMDYTIGGLARLEASLRSSIEGEVPVAAVLADLRRRYDGPERIRRRDGEPKPVRRVQAWSVTVRDVLSGGVDGYTARATSWARAVLDDLERSRQGEGRRPHGSRTAG